MSSDRPNNPSKFNFKPSSSTKSWQTVFLIAAPLFFLILIFYFLVYRSPESWQEIKNSSGQILSVAAAPAASLLGAPEQSWLAEIFSPKTESAPKENFLILGATGPGYDAPDLTDTILIAHLDPANKKIYLFSLPRDLLVKIPGGDNWTKLNALYAINKKNQGHEFDLIAQKVQEISGLAINHYVLVELATVKNLVDILHGVNVMVKNDILDTAFPGPNHSYQTFEIKAGWRYLDGETALKYIRSRHSVNGDFDRIERQQQVLQALKQKVLQLSFWDAATYWNIFNTLASQIKTDLNLLQIKDFWQLVKNIPAQDTVKTEINNAELMTTGSANFDGQTASVVEPKAGPENYEAIKEYITAIIKK